MNTEISMDKDQLIEFPIRAALQAGKAILEVYHDVGDIEIITKDDNSPLTKADQASNEVINSFLKQTPYPIISEENRQIPYEGRKDWEFCWIVDPLDGTKEFIKRNVEFTVNIALCCKGKPIFGVIYVPVTRELYYSDSKNGQAFKSIMDQDHKPVGPLYQKIDRIYPATSPDKLLKVVGSRSHMNEDTEAFVAEMNKKYEEVEIVSKGSSLKFCMVAEGKAHLYPRYAPTMEWDTAAGSAIVESVGLQVINRETGQPLLYNKENLLNPHFLVCNK
jgi:3'(2'), 5'-bisphosphate nucleotidase